MERPPVHRNGQQRHHDVMPNKDRPLVDRHPPKDGEGWLWSEQEQKVCRFRNDIPTAHGKWVEIETRTLCGNGQPK